MIPKFKIKKIQCPKCGSDYVVYYDNPIRLDSQCNLCSACDFTWNSKKDIIEDSMGKTSF